MKSIVLGSSSLINDYVALTKPRIIVLLLVTALGGIFMAADGRPSINIILLVFGGGALASGGANALNHYLDRDIDGRMERTQNRPVAGGRILPYQALLFGLILNVAAFIIFGLFVNILSGILALSSTLFYVFVYTKGLKRTTPQNIVIGGAAGAMPPVIGWAAVTGGLGLEALYLFSIIFFWTPPHFWALSLLIKDDYEKANIPMLPVVVGDEATRKSIFLYTLVLVALTLMFFATQAVGWIYFGFCLTSGAIFIFLARRLMRQADRSAARTLYLYSLLYLALLFVALMIDSIIGI